MASSLPGPQAFLPARGVPVSRSSLLVFYLVFLALLSPPFVSGESNGKPEGYCNASDDPLQNPQVLHCPKMVDAVVLEKLEAGFQKLQDATDCKSLLKKFLTREVFDKTKNLKTSFGSSLLDVIQSGTFHSNSTLIERLIATLGLLLR